MRVVIISDIHDNQVNLKKCLDWCREERIEKLICLGDVTDSETLAFMSKNFKGKIHLVRGNADNYDEDEPIKYNNIRLYDRKGGTLELGNKKIGICHEPYHIKNLFHQSKFDIVFYGHTHKPWESSENGVKLINPGALGGMFQKATFAVWDTAENEPELKILELM